ncbi:MAG TPA: UDP-N-acetylmuramoyl-tripeptide--D-alanyl-D-alanine ligase [Patescibacteria group bacterium]|nr:UDP-N-acetylmuramoyl-tripeptide--D-alanyl-D-alanine ligase [Patescibacteria group bacterium]
MKKIARSIVVEILGWQVRRLRRKNSFKIIGVAGSIGKTSTKLAVASMLSQGFRVRFQEGNYNDLVSAPLVFFGQSMPTLLNPFGWAKIFINNELCLRRLYPFDYIILELGVDGSGQLIQFKKYLQLDMGILTSLTSEHMEFFKSLDEVAKEELQIQNLSRKLLVNNDLCDDKYLNQVSQDSVTYGIHQKSDYMLTNIQSTADGYDFSAVENDEVLIEKGHSKLISEIQLYSLCCAVAVGKESGMSKQQLKSGVDSVKPMNGRMQILKGAKDSTIIDDTYNAGPETMKAALDTLYRVKSQQKIALLGNMNELGKFSADAHLDIGNYCDPKHLKLVITIGNDANRYLAKAAEAKGCDVKRFNSPYKAGEYLKRMLKPDAIVLAKGSQNGVFAEEAIKQILADPKDASKLVRQSSRWLKFKREKFES